MTKPQLIAFNMYETWVDKWSSENPYKHFFSTLNIEKHIATELSYLLMTSPQNIEDILPKYIIQQSWFDLALEKFYADAWSQLHNLNIYPDFLSTIQFLKDHGYQTAVVSNLSKLYVYPLDHIIPADTFDYKALSFELGVSKPDKQIFDSLRYQSGISADQTVMIWDSFRADVQWAFNAWIQPIHINRSKQWISDHWRYTQISVLKDLEEILK